MDNLIMRENKREEELEIDLLLLVKAIWKKAWIILTAALLCGSLAYAGVRFGVTPTYKTSFTAYVNNKTDSSDTQSLTNADLQASQNLVNTYAQIIKSRSVLTQAAENIGIEYSYAKLKGMVSTSTLADTEIIEVSVIGEDPVLALALAEEILVIVPDAVSRIVEGSSLQIIDVPVFPESRYSPSFDKFILLGILAGGFISMLIIVIQELLDNRIKSEKELEERLGIPVVGSIPDLLSAQKEQGGYAYRKKGAK